MLLLTAKAGSKATGFANHATNLGMMVGINALSSGGNMGGAVARGVVDYAVESLVPGAFTIGLIAGATKMGVGMYQEEKLHGHGRVQKYYRGNFGGEFNDTQTGYTMRQRSVQAMQQSKLNARSVLGSEARSFHIRY